MGNILAEIGVLAIGLGILLAGSGVFLWGLRTFLKPKMSGDDLDEELPPEPAKKPAVVNLKR